MSITQHTIHFPQNVAVISPSVPNGMVLELATSTFPFSADPQPSTRESHELYSEYHTTLVPVITLNTSIVSTHTAPEAQTTADNSCLFPSPPQMNQPPLSEDQVSWRPCLFRFKVLTELPKRRTIAISRVFGAAGTAPTGLGHHCRQLEADLESPDSITRSVWQAAWPDSPLSPVTFWEWVSRVVSVVEHLNTTNSTKPTFRDVAMLLYPGIDGGSAQVTLVSKVIIVAVCSLTALARVSAITPQSASMNPEILRMEIPNAEDAVQSQIDYPLTEIFTSIREVAHAASRRESTTGAPDQIQTDLVDYTFLRRMGIQIKFVTAITEHLYFDFARKELWVFKSPSICLATLWGTAIADMYVTAPYPVPVWLLIMDPSLYT